MRTAKLKIGNHELITLVAETIEEQEKGLMHQPWPPPIMTFVYNSPRKLFFWMKDTPSPLDIIFCNSNIIKLITEGQPYSTSLIGDGGSYDMVIELPKNTVKNLNIKNGQEVKLFI